MKSFGYKAPDPRIEQVPTPVGAKCQYCKKVIAEGDHGLILPFHGEPGDSPEHVLHVRCMAQIMGKPCPPKTTRSN
jgi:hypothetical protein